MAMQKNLRAKVEEVHAWVGNLEIGVRLAVSFSAQIVTVKKMCRYY